MGIELVDSTKKRVAPTAQERQICYSLLALRLYIHDSSAAGSSIVIATYVRVVPGPHHLGWQS